MKISGFLHGSFRQNVLYCFAVICLIVSSLMGANAQTLEQARKLYTERQWDKAMPVFARELQRKPSDASLNYWYGVCLFETGAGQKAVPYLKKGEKGRIKGASWYLAVLAYGRWDFDACQDHLDRYISYATGMHTQEMARLIRQMERLKQMLATVEDVVFVDSVAVAPEHLKEHIVLHPSCGKLIDGEAFAQLTGQMAAAGTLAHLNEMGDRLIGCDTAFSLKSCANYNDRWEVRDFEEGLGADGLCSDFNPYLMSDGVTLYFASRRDNSLPAPDLLSEVILSRPTADLYVSRYNAVSETYYPPELLPFPFNSDSDDLLYVVDDLIGRGYLVSRRWRNDDSLTVYTFIPNRQRRLLRGLSPEETMARARLTCIRDTWGDVDVDSVRNSWNAQYRAAVEDMKPVAKESDPLEQPVFFVCDGLSLQSAEEFQSAEARELYRRWISLEESFRKDSSELQNNRKAYGLAGSQGNLREMKRLARLIGEAEIRLPEQEDECCDLENRIRRLELTARNLLLY